MSDLLLTAGLVLAGYLLGAVPFSFLVARACGVDLRTVGSGNIGGANVWRSCGFGPFLAAASLDLLKGFAPAFAAQALGLSPAAVVLVGAAAILGHTRSVFLGFRGGKAVATSGGVLLAVAPLLLLVGLAAWVIGFAISRISAVGSLSAAAAVLLAATVFFALGQLPVATLVFVWAVGLAVVALHRANIRRLREGTENRFRSFRGGSEGQGPSEKTP